jgi:hypothetical protein
MEANPDGIHHKTLNCLRIFYTLYIIIMCIFIVYNSGYLYMGIDRPQIEFD